MSCKRCYGPVGLHRPECPLTSRWLAVRLIARLPPERRINLEQRIRDHAENAEIGLDARGNGRAYGPPTPRYEPTLRILGRLAAII